jgi:cell division protein FtsL
MPERQTGWLSHALKQAPWRTQTQTTSVVMTTVVVVLVIGALYLAQATRTATAGRTLQKLELEKQMLEQQNAQLRAEIAALQSVPRLIASAQGMGYRPARPDEIEYLPVPGLAPATAPTPAPAEDVPVYDETLRGWLDEQVDVFRKEWGIFLGGSER